jgi:UDP-N-acetylmuramyl pentapeptide phosphotransferase/UDP-N-acetylglucosamine-1-phosphate transferase
LPLGLLIWPLGLFVFVAESNATNLTDGLDGLAGGCGAVVFTGMALQLMLRGHGGDPSLAAFCAAMAGCWLGFLSQNRYPAKVFMGDTGSLAMGAALTAVALLSDSLWPLLLMGGVFLAESLSVILQVWVYKATKDDRGEAVGELDMVLDAFIKRSVSGGLGSAPAEILANTAVALASRIAMFVTVLRVSLPNGMARKRRQ